MGLVVESVCAFFSPAIHAKGVSLVVDASEGRGRKLNADRNLLETLLLILLSNALDAVSPGEIRVFCQQSAPDRTGFAVQDNGCGISAAHRERRFPHGFDVQYRLAVLHPLDEFGKLAGLSLWNYRE